MEEILSYLGRSKDVEDRIDQVFDELESRYRDGIDAWGLDLKKAKQILKLIYPLYTQYFNVRVFRAEEDMELYNKPMLLAANHTGQIAIDGMLISIAFVLEMTPPRIMRTMVERFFSQIPFVNSWASEAGAVLGDRKNCLKLLEKGETILAFPEGVSGVAKSTSEFYSLQRFTTGYIRLAIQGGVDILPVAVIGAEEVFPWVYQAKDLAKFLNLPALPISPIYFPLPAPIDIYIGKPYKIPTDLHSDSPEEEIEFHSNKIREDINSMIVKGLKNKRTMFNLPPAIAKKFGL